jgi:hypothetical protein
MSAIYVKDIKKLSENMISIYNLDEIKIYTEEEVENSQLEECKKTIISSSIKGFEFKKHELYIKNKFYTIKKCADSGTFLEQPFSTIKHETQLIYFL